MTISVYDFQDYKPYLNKLIAQQLAKGRGFRARMAECMGCQRSFVSTILQRNSAVHLGLEQAEKLNALLGHSKDEAQYFVLLVGYCRAGTEGLREFYRDQMKQVLNRRLQVSKELQSRNVLSPEDHMRYYSSWYYSAIRVAVSVPDLQTKEALSQRLGLPMPTIVAALDFLVSRGLVERKGSRFVHCSQGQILLPSDHDLTNKHHTNWRTRALASLDRPAGTDLHYSYVVSISEHDALRIRSMLVETLKEILQRAGPSREETMFALCLDYFSV